MKSYRECFHAQLFLAFTSLSKLKQMYYYFSLLLLRGTKFHFSTVKNESLVYNDRDTNKIYFQLFIESVDKRSDEQNRNHPDPMPYSLF